MEGIIVDHRTRDTHEPYAWAVATDKFMSGWGLAPVASYVAYPVYSYEDEIGLLAWMDARSDYIRVRLNAELPRLSYGKHLSIYDRPRSYRY